MSTMQTYTLAELRNGTGFPKGAQFVSVESLKHANTTPEDIADQFEHHAARAFFASAWADECDENGPGVGAGVEIMDVMPDEIDPAAVAAARDLRMRMEATNKLSISRLFGIVLMLAQGDREPSSEMFGHYCAMQAMGHGVGLSDAFGDRVHSKVKVPYVEFGSHSLERDYFTTKPLAYTWRRTPAGALVLSNAEGADVANVYRVPSGKVCADPWGRERRHFSGENAETEARDYVQSQFGGESSVFGGAA